MVEMVVVVVVEVGFMWVGPVQAQGTSGGEGICMR